MGFNSGFKGLMPIFMNVPQLAKSTALKHEMPHFD